MTEAMRMRMNWVRIDVDDRMIFKTDLLLWDEEKEKIKMVPRWWLPVIHVFAAISSNLSKMSLICKPYQWYGWILTKCLSLQLKLGGYEKYWTEGEQNVLVTRWKGESVAAPRKKIIKSCVIFTFQNIESTKTVSNLLGLFSVLELQKI